MTPIPLDKIPSWLLTAPEMEKVYGQTPPVAPLKPVSNIINMRVSLIEANIAHLEVHAVVNAANSKLERGTGVCDAIFKGAGFLLEQQCILKGRCEVGDVVVTD